MEQTLAAGLPALLCEPRLAFAGGVPAARASILEEYDVLICTSGISALPTFGLMFWLAAVAAAFVMDRGFRRADCARRWTPDAVGMVAVAVVAGIVGAKLWHVLDTPAEFRELGWRVLWDSAGFAWFGGLLFGISALMFQGWWAKIGGAADAGSGRAGGCHWLRHRAHRLLSFRRRLLRDSNQAALGHELPQRH